MEAFADRVLGKGVVRAKDTPNFIGNRIGSFGLGIALREMMAADLTIEEVDALTGPAIGRAKSAHLPHRRHRGGGRGPEGVGQRLPAVPHDPQREVFKLPDFVRTMVERKMLGDKTGGGFYRKEGAEIRTLDWKTLEYRERRKAEAARGGGGRRTWPTSARASTRSWREGQGGHVPLARAVGDELLRGLAGARDLRRHRVHRPRHGVGLPLGPRALPADGRRRRGRDGGARAGRGPRGSAAGGIAAGLRPQEVLRGRGRASHRLRPRRRPRSRAPGRHRPRVAEAARGRGEEEEPGRLAGGPRRRLRPGRVPLQDEHAGRGRDLHAPAVGEGRRARTSTRWWSATRASSSRWAPT